MEPTLTGPRPIAEVVNDEYPVSGVVFAEGKAPEKYVEEPGPVKLTGLRALLGSILRS